MRLGLFGACRSVAADTPAPSCPSVPGPPASVSAADPSGQAQVSWTVPPTDGDQTITGYRGPGRPNQWRDRTGTIRACFRPVGCRVGALVG